MKNQGEGYKKNCSKLRVIKKLNVSQVEVGQIYGYSITIENLNSFKIENVRITDIYGWNTKVLSVEVDGKEIEYCQRDGRSAYIVIGKLDVYDKKVIYVTAKVTSYIKEAECSGRGKVKGIHRIDNSEEEIFEYFRQPEMCIINPKVTLTKINNIYETAVGDIVIFYILAENTGNVPVKNVIVRDLLRGELRFQDKSITVNCVAKEEENIISGINIGDLQVGEKKEIKFEAEVLSMPECGILKNKAIGKFSYCPKELVQEKQKLVKSNENKILIHKEDLCIKVKTDKEPVSLGDVITYTINLENIGTVRLVNIILKDVLSKSVEVVDGSFNIRGQKVNNIDLGKGVLVGTLEVGERAVIEYKVRYIRGGVLGNILNKVIIEKDYMLCDGNICRGKDKEVCVSISTNISTFKQLIVDGEICIQDKDVKVEEVENVNSSVEIIEYHVIKTVLGKSNEGQILTGYKVIIEGKLNQVIEYTAKGCSQSVHSIYCKEPFSTWIVLPYDFSSGNKLEIDYSVEDSYCKVLKERLLYNSTTILLKAKVLC